MPLSPYKGFKPLNDRRLDLIKLKHRKGLSKDQKRELEMLEECTSAMIDYRWPLKTWTELAELMDRLNSSN